MNDWYNVQLDEVLTHTEEFLEIYQWAVDQFEQNCRDDRWSYYFDVNTALDTFSFKRKEDAMLFALRWK